MSDTGHGATVSFTGLNSVGSLRRIRNPVFKRGVIDDTHLGVSGDFMTSIPADLAEIDEVEITFVWEGDWPDITSAAATCTITHPLGPAGATAANIAGTAFVTEVDLGELQTNELTEISCKIKYDGKTGPTTTAEVAA